MKVKLGIAVVTLLLSVSCKDDADLPACIEGTVIGYEHCTNGILIQVDERYAIGKTVTYNRESYVNVVKAPNPSGAYLDTFYFRFRKYHNEEDLHLFGPPVPCLAIYVPYDVPTIVITSASQEPCTSAARRE